MTYLNKKEYEKFYRETEKLFNTEYKRINKIFYECIFSWLFISAGGLEEELRGIVFPHTSLQGPVAITISLVGLGIAFASDLRAEYMKNKLRQKEENFYNRFGKGKNYTTYFQSFPPIKKIN